MVKIKWVACYIVLNGDEYLWYSLKSIYNFIKDTDGKIIIIEGSTEYAGDVAADGNSSDKTKEIIDGFIKDSDKDFIIYKRLGKIKNKQVLRNAYLNEIKKLPEEQKPEWVLVMDDDELYKIEDLRRLDKFLTKNPKIEYILNPQRWFWKDFKTEAYSSENECLGQISNGFRKDKLYYDMVSERLRQGQYHERIYKWNKNIQHIHHAVVSDEVPRDIYIHPDYEDKRIVFPGCPRYHYGYMTTTDRMFERYHYYEKRDKKRETSTIKKDEVWTDNYGHYLLRDVPKNTSTRTRPYYGEHPVIMKEHPYWKLGKCPMAVDAETMIKTLDFSWTYETFDEHDKIVILYRHEYVLDRLKPNSTILDMGGLGRFAYRLNQEGHKVTVVNKNKYDIKTKSDNVVYRYGDFLGEKGFPLNRKLRFDYVNCSETLENIEDKELALSKMYDILKKDGAFFGTVPMPGKYSHKTDAKDRDFSIVRLKKMLKRAKFKNIEVKELASMKKENEATVFWFFGEK